MVAQVAQIVDVQSLVGEECLNVYHFVDTAGTGEIADLVSDFLSETIPLIRAVQTDQLTHTAIRYRLVAPTDTLTATFPISPPQAGLDTTTAALANAYALSMAWALGATVVLSGGFTGHLKRGGARTPGPSEGMAEENGVTSTTATNWAAAFASLQNPGTGAWQLCVASYLNGARARQTTVQSYALVIGSSAPAMSTQNTRKILRGRIS